MFLDILRTIIIYSSCSLIFAIMIEKCHNNNSKIKYEQPSMKVDQYCLSMADPAARMRSMLDNEKKQEI